MSALFDNAIDSLREGLRIYIGGAGGTAPKHAIRNIFHAVELLLKERLSREHPLFIYRSLDKPVSDESQTVGLDEALARFHNLGIRLTASEIGTLKDLRKRRNRIEHHSFQQDQSHNLVVGKAFQFVYYFLRDHLETTLEEVLDEEMFPKAREAILGYEEALNEAEEEVCTRTTAKTKGDLDTLPRAAYCPECQNETLVVGSEKGDYCFFCAQVMDVDTCERCSEVVSSLELEETGVCLDCEASWQWKGK